MELDGVKLALGRIETSLQRLERLVADRGTANVGEAPRNPALEAEVMAVIAELDRLIDENDRG